MFLSFRYILVTFVEVHVDLVWVCLWQRCAWHFIAFVQGQFLIVLVVCGVCAPMFRQSPTNCLEIGWQHFVRFAFLGGSPGRLRAAEAGGILINVFCWFRMVVVN